MACTARTYQRLMEKALSERWWPLMHNAEGTFGSIDLGYKYDELMNSLRCSSQSSCLEKGLDHIGKDNLKEILENQSVNEAERLTEMHCSFAANRVDSEDRQTGKSGNTDLPVFTDKIWAAALKAHGFTLSESPDLTRPCIDVLPFVVAFCAAEYTCMDTDSIDGFFSPNDLQVAREKAAKTVAPLTKHAHAITMKKSLSEEERRSYDQQWETLVTSKFHDLDAESDAFQWTLLWQMANVSHNVGLMSSWPEILEALYGTRKIDWTNTRLYWEKVLFTAHLRLRLRELKSNGSPAIVQDERSLNHVILNLQSIYETKLCSPGALGGLKDDNLERLGVKDSATLAIHSLDRDDVVKGMWRNWMVLHVKKTWSSSAAKNRFLQLLDDRGCSCMCYEACGKLQASAVASCQGLAPGNVSASVESGARRVGTRTRKLRVEKVVMDRIGKPAHENFTSAVYLQVLHQPTLGGCDTQLQVSSRYSRPFKGFISKCSVPDYFEHSEDLGLTITLWMDEERNDKIFDYSDFEQLHRPYSDWGDQEFNREADD